VSWNRLDDGLHSHPKAQDAGLEAMGLWCLTLSHCGAYLTDGHLKRAAAHRIACSEKKLDELSSRLVAAGLWELHPSGDGWQVHDYAEYNPSREQVLAEREARRAGGQKGAARRWAGSAPIAPPMTPPIGPPKGGPIGSADAPVPSRSRPDPDPVPLPDPTEKKQRGASRAQLPLVDAGEAAVPRDRADEQQVVFDAWVKARREKFKATGTPRLDPERRKAIEDAVKLGYCCEELVLAVRGWVLRHDNKHAAKTKGLQWALESAANIDEGIAAARAQSMPDKSGRDVTLAGRLLSEIAEFEADEGQSEAVRSTLRNLRDLLARFRSAPPEQRAEVAREVRAALGARGVNGAMAEVAQ
jgi:hypothetical protein